MSALTCSQLHALTDSVEGFRRKPQLAVRTVLAQPALVISTEDHASIWIGITAAVGLIG